MKMGYQLCCSNDLFEFLNTRADAPFSALKNVLLKILLSNTNVFFNLKEGKEKK